MNNNENIEKIFSDNNYKGKMLEKIKTADVTTGQIYSQNFAQRKQKDFGSE